MTFAIQTTGTEWVRSVGSGKYVIVKPGGCYIGMGQLVSNPNYAREFTAEEINKRYGGTENIPWEK